MSGSDFDYPPAASDWLLRYGDKLPQFNPAFAGLVGQVSWEHGDMQVLERVVAADPGSVVRLLRVANSPFFGLSKQVDTIQGALTVIGLAAARSMLIRGYLLDTFGAADDDVLANDFVMHSIVTGVAARLLAAEAGVAQDVALIAGILHDAGKLLMVIYARSLVERIYSGEATGDDDSFEDEIALFGFDHAELGACLLDHWALPEPVVQAVRRHHHRELCVTPLERTVFAANRVADHLIARRGAQDQATAQARLDELAIDPAELARLEERVDAELSLMFAMNRAGRPGG